MRADALLGVRVLLVDDDPRFLETVAEIFTRAGASMTAVTSARLALEAFDRERFDVVITDIVMPEINGYSLVRRIRERPPDRGGAVPVIAVSGLPLDGGEIPPGLTAHFAKPLRVTDLVAAVTSVVSGAPWRRAVEPESPRTSP